ncbi:MAG: hypothetical protein Fur009_7100 [Candidatus Microgenomates bacterium]
MISSLKELLAFFEKYVKKLISNKKNKFALTIFSVGNSVNQTNSIKLKQKIAKKLGVKINLINIKNVPNFINFAKQIKKEAEKEDVQGIIIERPLPAQLSTDSIYNYIPAKKEIEGLKLKSLIYPPQGLAVLTLIKYYFTGKITEKIIINPKKEGVFWKKFSKSKKIVLLGHDGIYAKPISKVMQDLKISFLNIDLKVKSTESYLLEADIIINTTDEKLDQYQIKPNVLIIQYSPNNPTLETLSTYYLFKNLVDIK